MVDDVGDCTPPPDVVLVDELEPDADDVDEVGLDVVVVDVGRVVLVEDDVFVTKPVRKFKPKVSKQCFIRCNAIRAFPIVTRIHDCN